MRKSIEAPTPDEHGPFCILCGECYACMVKAEPPYDRWCEHEDGSRTRHRWNRYQVGRL